MSASPRSLHHSRLLQGREVATGCGIFTLFLLLLQVEVKIAGDSVLLWVDRDEMLSLRQVYGPPAGEPQPLLRIVLGGLPFPPSKLLLPVPASPGWQWGPWDGSYVRLWERDGIQLRGEPGACVSEENYLRWGRRLRLGFTVLTDIPTCPSPSRSPAGPCTGWLSAPGELAGSADSALSLCLYRPQKLQCRIAAWTVFPSRDRG